MSDFAQGREQGIKEERDRLIAFLREKKALRTAFFIDYLILYTENGPIEITQEELEND